MANIVPFNQRGNQEVSEPTVDRRGYCNTPHRRRTDPAEVFLLTMTDREKSAGEPDHTQACDPCIFSPLQKDPEHLPRCMHRDTHM